LKNLRNRLCRLRFCCCVAAYFVAAKKREYVAFPASRQLVCRFIFQTDQPADFLSPSPLPTHKPAPALRFRLLLSSVCVARGRILSRFQRLGKRFVIGA
ncbi:hypothetical protein, partial [Cupriavidus plantarum]|uniref:hypothetical protein n=3 Tax=Cupriavidus plantarum TaxID=942865 RepID=UPI00339D5066